MPGSMALFKKIRPRDINLEVGIGQENNYLRYYVFNDTALNGFSAELSRQYTNERERIRIEKVIEVEVLPLREILSRYFARDFCKIDFMTVDVEGFDLQVLSSNDWSLYRPTYVLAEALKSSLDSFEADPLAKFMREQGYAVFSKQVNTVFFRDTSS